jgi:small multidrug resistance family-3 protein
MTLTTHAVTLFVPEGLCEIGDGFLVWQWWRNGTPWGIGLLSAVTLVLDGIVPTDQPADLWRV